MLDEFSFLFPPLLPQETELPEAFDRAHLESQLDIQPVGDRARRRTRTRTRKRRASKEASILAEDFLNELRIERGLSKGALNSCEKDLQIYLAWLQAQGVKQLSEVTAAHVAAYKHDLEGGQLHKVVVSKKRPAMRAKFYAAPTLARKLAVIRDWHRFLARQYGWDNPALQLQVTTLHPSGATRTRLILSIEQMQALLRAPNRWQIQGKRDRAILCLLCEGLSATEISALRRDIDWNSELVLSDNAKAVLREYRELARPHLAARLKKKRRYSFRLFFSQRGRPLSVTTIHQIVRRHAEAAHLPAWVSATNLTKNGAARRAARENGREAIVALPRATQLRQAYEKAHPRA